tara:strand:- start:57784 stop:58527 length:744 start_codon:yes stop_codon:yes gene_type:complete
VERLFRPALMTQGLLTMRWLEVSQTFRRMRHVNRPLSVTTTRSANRAKTAADALVIAGLVEPATATRFAMLAKIAGAVPVIAALAELATATRFARLVKTVAVVLAIAARAAHATATRFVMLAKIAAVALAIAVAAAVATAMQFAKIVRTAPPAHKTAAVVTPRAATPRVMQRSAKHVPAIAARLTARHAAMFANVARPPIPNADFAKPKFAAMIPFAAMSSGTTHVFREPKLFAERVAHKFVVTEPA